MVQELAKEIIQKAVELDAQDIYLLPREIDYELYMRIGDERRFMGEYDRDKMASLISHFKFVSGMNVGEKRRSQLGSCDYELNSEEKVSLRLSSVGDYRGQESLVIRILFSGRIELKYWFDGLNKLKEKLSGRGLYLFSGPVGSGKTTLMHQLVAERFSGQQVISIEDPVEIKDPSMLQLQLNDSIGMTYDALIKLSLRHRPDVLIIGEIRDSETARAVIRASLTGTVVFSTIHAKSIPGVYARLLELGVSPEELHNSLRGIAYQRLIGKGGIIDYAQDHFQNHKPDQWNDQMDQLVADGHLTFEEGKIEKITAERPA
ncbi:competence type IV pilus ATPase ComGA [Streptococcus sp. S784/96/1]|uniref:competence type IV pilus ATPase ComGA n=1 Tax=Streptococcus sp. S784/96/1 TaxID=2653499 RepID=UPI0013870DBA|nr:competence type IV pilus ATPase ComGA [Streptococcus sp. S784/96/1]